MNRLFLGSTLFYIKQTPAVTESHLQETYDAKAQSGTTSKYKRVNKQLFLALESKRGVQRAHLLALEAHKPAAETI